MELAFDTLPADIDAAESEIIKSNDLTCQVCGKALTYGGRGRKPKFCDDHKTSIKGVPSGSGKKASATVDILVQNIEQFYGTIGMGLTFVPGMDKDGIHVTENAAALAASWKPVIESNPKVRKFWEKTFTTGAYGGLVITHAMVLLPILQAHNLIPTQNKETTTNGSSEN